MTTSVYTYTFQETVNKESKFSLFGDQTEEQLKMLKL